MSGYKLVPVLLLKVGENVKVKYYNQSLQLLVKVGVSVFQCIYSAFRVF